MSTLNILICDDDDTSRTLLRIILKRIPDVSVEFASNGEEAFHKICCASYDVLLTDLDMPVMSGVELINKLRQELKSSLPVAIMTGSFF